MGRTRLTTSLTSMMTRTMITKKTMMTVMLNNKMAKMMMLTTIVALRVEYVILFLFGESRQKSEKQMEGK